MPDTEGAIAALDDLKVVDLACGSGAYLLGLLQEMVVPYPYSYLRSSVLIFGPIILFRVRPHSSMVLSAGSLVKRR